MRITIPSEIEPPEYQCFQNCISLEEVIFADNSKLWRIGKCAFHKSGLKKITIPSEVGTCDICLKFRQNFLRGRLRAMILFSELEITFVIGGLRGESAV